MKKYIKSAVQPITDMDTQSQVEIAMTTTSEDTLWELLNNPNGCSWVVCLAIADNRYATDDILRELTRNSNATVKAAAKWNLENKDDRGWT